MADIRLIPLDHVTYDDEEDLLITCLVVCFLTSKEIIHIKQEQKTVNLML